MNDTLKYVVALPLDGKFFHIKCCVHILNILVQYGMTEIESAVHNVRASVKYITNSVSLLQVFGDIVSQLRLPDIKLILDCGTRWNATYAMVVVAIGYKDVFSRYADKDLSYSFLPSDEDREKAKLVCNFLEEFDMITNLISGTDYPTSNLLLPELWHIKKILDEACSSEDSCLMKMATKMKKKFDKYWGDCNLLISLAAILDPRNKIKFIEFAFTEIYKSDNAVRHLNEIRECLYKLFEEYMSSHKLNIVEGPSQSESQSQASKFTGSGKGKSRGRVQFDSMMRIVDILPTEKSELDVYLEEIFVSRRGDRPAI